MPPKRYPLDQLPLRTQSETTFARLSTRPVGLSLAPTERPHVWESRGPPFTSACKSLAFHVPRQIPSPRSGLAIIRSTLQSMDTVPASDIRWIISHLQSN